MFQMAKSKPGKIAILGSLALFFCFLPSYAFAAKPAPNSTPQAVSIAPSSGTVSINTPVSFTSVYSDADGWQNLAQAKLLINTSTTLTNCLYAYYDQNTNKLYLRNDKGTGWLGGFAPGSANTIQNSYAIVDCSKSAISGSGTTLSVTWSVTFKPAFTGTKNLYLYVTDDKNASQGWVNKGTILISQALSISITPGSWNIGLVNLNTITTMLSANMITVTNDGGGPETFALSLVNPSGWTAGNTPGSEVYVLSGLFCGTSDIVQPDSFGQEGLDDDVVTTASKSSTSTNFAYRQGLVNGMAVPKGVIRALYLQFKSPVITAKNTQQDINLIISCQVP